MLRNTQSLAINLIRGLYETAEGQPKQGRSLDDFDLPKPPRSCATPQPEDGYLWRAETGSVLRMLAEHLDRIAVHPISMLTLKAVVCGAARCAYSHGNITATAAQ